MSPYHYPSSRNPTPSPAHLNQHPPHFLPNKHRKIPFIPPDPKVSLTSGPTFLPKHKKASFKLPESDHVIPPTKSPPSHEVYHHSTSAVFDGKNPKIPFHRFIEPDRYMHPPDQPYYEEKDDGTTISISFGQNSQGEPSISISNGASGNPDLAEPGFPRRPPKQIVFPTTKLQNNQPLPPPTSPVPQLKMDEFHNSFKIQPRTIELLKKLGFHYQPETQREVPSPPLAAPPTHLPPRLYDKTPPTLYNPVYSKYSKDMVDNSVEFAPPKLGDYLPPTLFDPATSINKPPSTLIKSELFSNPFLKFVSKEDRNNYYTKSDSSPEESVSAQPLEVGVGSKTGPSPDQVYKAQLRYPMGIGNKVPAIKFEVYNKSQPAIRFEDSDQAYPVLYYPSSSRKEELPEEVEETLYRNKNKYKYKSKIRYKDNKQYREKDVFYQNPLNDVDEKYVSVLERERLYRNDFPSSTPRTDERLYRKDFPRSTPRIDEDFSQSVHKRKIDMRSSVPCHDCVLVKRNSSSIYDDQDVIPSSQISKLPYPTQIPRPPYTPSKLPYLPLAKYKSVKNKSQSPKVIKSLPDLPAARNSPQYPFHNSYVLAKLKRSDVPK